MQSRYSGSVFTRPTFIAGPEFKLIHLTLYTLVVFADNGHCSRNS